jgi:hypothetical protein
MRVVHPEIDWPGKQRRRRDWARLLRHGPPDRHTERHRVDPPSPTLGPAKSGARHYDIMTMYSYFMCTILRVCMRLHWCYVYASGIWKRIYGAWCIWFFLFLFIGLLAFGSCDLRWAQYSCWFSCTIVYSSKKLYISWTWGIHWKSNKQFLTLFFLLDFLPSLLRCFIVRPVGVKT